MKSLLFPGLGRAVSYRCQLSLKGGQMYTVLNAEVVLDLQTQWTPKFLLL